MRSVVQWCERIIEACWLLALTAVPLFFNPLSNNTYEPEKAVLLRALSLVGILAWTIVRVARAGGTARGGVHPGRLWLGRGALSSQALPVALVGVFAS